MAEDRTFVLVPGAGHGAWQWAPVARRLRAAGSSAVALTLPGLGHGDPKRGWTLQDAVDRVVDEVVSRDLSSVTLVAHSWGGFPATGAAHRLGDRLSAMVFYSAFVPRRGVSLVDESPRYADAIREQIRESPDGTTSVTREQMSTLVPGTPESTRDLLFELLEPTPGRYYTDTLDVPDLTTLGIGLAYVQCEDELVLARPGAEFAARLGLTPVVVPGGHDGMLTHPDAVADALLTA